MPMTDEQFKDFLTKLTTSQKVINSQVATKIDTSIPLPIGTKSITGLIGAITGFAAIYFGIVPKDEIAGKVVELAILAFTSLGGLGIISKFQRYINIAEQSLQASLEILRQLKERAASD